MFQKMIFAALTATSVMAAASAMTATPSHAKVCKNFYVAATGPWRPTLIGARRHARRVWSRRVKVRVSTKFDTWIFSRGKNYKCRARAGKHKCRVWSTPCRGLL